MNYGLRILAGFLIISLVFLNSRTFAEPKQPNMKFKLFSKNEYNGEAIKWENAVEIIKTINDPKANDYIKKYNSLRSCTITVIMIGCLLTFGGVAPHLSDEEGNIVLLAAAVPFSLALVLSSIELYYQKKAIDRYNKVVGETNKSSSLHFSPGRGEHAMGFRYSF